MKNLAPYRIFFTEAVPVTSSGKPVQNLWKKADSYCDFFDMIEMKKSVVKGHFAMLYDHENLYIRTKYSTPNEFHPPKDGGDFSGTYIILFFHMDSPEGKKVLKISYSENGKSKIAVDNKEVTVWEGLKSYWSGREGKSRYSWEALMVISLQSLHLNARTLAGKDLPFSLYHIRHDPEWECIYPMSLLSYGEGAMQPKSQWISGVFTADGAEPVTVSAAEELKKTLHQRSITLSPERCLNKRYTNILGMNNSPRIRSRTLRETEKELFRKLAPARVRHHDAVLSDPGFALIDITRIFPLFHADENDPRNYNFAPTDFYLKQVVECGVPIEFRIGESIEHSGTIFRVNPPEDAAKWARICVNILRHYKEGWADGMYLDIAYASIWEEPDGVGTLFGGPYEKYLEMYKHVSIALKQAFPDLKVGGPQAIFLSRIEEFLAYCRENSLPVDFLGTTSYARIPYYFSAKALEMRQKLIEYGYPDAEIFFAEWHYCPRSWKKTYMADAPTVENAAFSAAGIIELQDVADMAYFYLWASMGYYGLFASPSNLYPVYYALCLYTEFVRKDAAVLPLNIEKEQCPGLYLLASCNQEEDLAYVFAARFKCLTDELEVLLPEQYKVCRMKIVASSSPKGEVVQEFTSSGKGRFVIPFTDRFDGAYLLEFAKK